MKFIWDENKNKKNIKDHKIDFNDAKFIFDEPMLTFLDLREDYGEDRWIGIGSLRSRIVIILFTELQKETIRVISIRKALKHERNAYEKEIKNRLGRA